MRVVAAFIGLELAFYALRLLDQNSAMTAVLWFTLALASILVYRGLAADIEVHPSQLGQPPRVRTTAGAIFLALAGVVVVYYFLPINESILSSVKDPGGVIPAVVDITVVPIEEEIAFRGLLYGLVEKRAGRRWALGISTLLFAASHAVIAVDGFYLLGVATWGLALGLLRRWSGGVIASVIAHSLGNLAAFA